jgi:hypothetical protein
MLRVPGRVYGARGGGPPIYEEVTTEIVSAHGALLNVSEVYPQGASLIFTNLVTEEEIACRVVFVGQTKEGQKQIAIEFTTSAPKFWRVHFPPPDQKPLKKHGSGR